MDTTLILYAFGYILGAVLGAALGSFINMLTYRVKRGLKLGGRSFADDTGEVLTGIDLVPVFSYVVFLGRSKTSGEKLPVLYPLIELCTGFVMLSVFVNFYRPTLPFFFVPLSFAVAFMTGIVFFASYDLQHMQLPKKEVIIFAVFALVAVLIEYLLGFRAELELFSGAAAAVIGLVGILLLQLIPSTGLVKKDALLTAGIGFYLGIQGLFWAFLFASIAGSLVGLIKMYKRKRLFLQLPYATVLGFGVAFYILFGQLVIRLIL